jgi:hypothetical protein
VARDDGVRLRLAGAQFWRECEARGYRAVFFPWWECDRVTYRLPLLAPDELGTLEPEEQDLVARHGLDLEQIKWRRKKIAEYGRSSSSPSGPRTPRAAGPRSAGCSTTPRR